MVKHLLLYVWIVLIGMFAVAVWLPNREGVTVDQRVAIPHLPSGPSANKQQQQAQSKQATGAAVPVVKQGQQGNAYDPGCPYPKEREDADLCEQRRMAKAAEEAVALADSQWWLGVFNLALLFVATLAAIAAAVFASRAAIAAQDTVAEARRIGEAQVRAYISWDGARIGFGIDVSSEVTGLMLAPRIKNTGQSPAGLVGLYSHLDLLEDGRSPNVSFDPQGIACNDVVGAGNPFEFAEQYLTREQAKQVFRRERRCYLLGWAAYRDVFSKDGDADRILTFCFEVSIRTPPELWTSEFVSKHPATGVISLTSNPIYAIGPSRPYV